MSGTDELNKAMEELKEPKKLKPAAPGQWDRLYSKTQDRVKIEAEKIALVEQGVQADIAEQLATDSVMQDRLNAKVDLLRRSGVSEKVIKQFLDAVKG